MKTAKAVKLDAEVNIHYSPLAFSTTHHSNIFISQKLCVTILEQLITFAC